MEQTADCDEEEVEDNTSNQLNEFREKWQEELKSKKPQVTSRVESPARNSPIPRADSPALQDEVYERAKELFMNGVWSEQNGLIYEAMDYYRRATKIVPDIDLQMAAQFRQSMAQNAANRQATEDIGDIASPDSLGDSTDDIDITDLCSHFEHLCSDNQHMTYCSPASTQMSTHISSLPGELLTYILRWIVSSEVDTRSLEQFSMVCRGFYVLARDPHIWQNICTRIWGLSCQSYQPYSSWRGLAIGKPHIYFHGVYMNKVELFRQGDATLEKFYPPWMKVVYYRYLRFFPDGVMFMYTSPSDPVSVISQLRSPNTHVEGMCKGMYRINDKQVSCILKRIKKKEVKQYRRYKRNQDQQGAIESETTFYIDLSIDSHGSQPNMILRWEKYSMSIYYSATENETSSEFALTKQDFPVCKFARVKSYTSDAYAPLPGHS